jgi:hypothetical protein
MVPQPSLGDLFTQALNGPPDPAAAARDAKKLCF